MERRSILILALAVGLAAKATIVTTVSSVSDLQALATSVNAGDSYSGVTVTLTANLDLSDVSWMPIGTTGNPFVGTFDGQGHTISNLNVNVEGKNTGNVAGLFGEIGTGGKVKDVNINGGTIQFNSVTASCYSGSIAGKNGGTIVGCSNSAEVRGNWTSANVGGIAGENLGTIQNCYNLGEVCTGNYESNLLGGIAGENKGTISNSFVRATITKVNEYGVIGKIVANGNGTVTGCFYMNGAISDFDSGDLLVVNNASDNSSTISDNIGSGKNVLLNSRTLYTDGDWNTICLPFNIPAGATGYSPIAGATVMTLESSSFSEGTLSLNFENATSIEAGKPYLVKWNTHIDDNFLNPVFMGVTVSNSTTATETSYVDFIGSFSATSITGTNKSILFLGARNTLYYPNIAMTIGSCRAYFQLNGLMAGDLKSEVKTFVLNFEDNFADGLTFVDMDLKSIPEESGISNPLQHGWYDLNGQRLSGKPNQHGIYIHNGKKEVLK